MVAVLGIVLILAGQVCTPQNLFQHPFYVFSRAQKLPIAANNTTTAAPIPIPVIAPLLSPLPPVEVGTLRLSEVVAEVEDVKLVGDVGVTVADTKSVFAYLTCTP